MFKFLIGFVLGCYATYWFATKAIDSFDQENANCVHACVNAHPIPIPSSKKAVFR